MERRTTPSTTGASGSDFDRDPVVHAHEDERTEGERDDRGHGQVDGVRDWRRLAGEERRPHRLDRAA